ncbi:uncharacterized protein B0H18DRAFT_34766 [Fomitopsis serialis]|uniref:uncharacterized protein n=1 Tax=Fomitopsis serialis TaxID=139415 RepID=UPI00200781E3|nr:uncharacterized protein B0H18DRAFT_34766 [Neoantrodia serialis]KAH9917462.1 hypothetical protein B0H18DRAFT_34766 [Neoantrodia serialis]
MVKLFVCSSCKKIYYCSRACQKKNWNHHKHICAEQKALNQIFDGLSLLSPLAAQRQKHWFEWRQCIDERPYVNALRLHKDCGQARTHLIIEESVYTPDADRRFTVVRCGVFRIHEALTEIERIMRLKPGGGAEACSHSLKRQPQDGPQSIAFIVFRFSEGVAPWLDRRTIDAEDLEQMPYNPKWRQDINKDHPPAKLILSEDLKDAEFD